MGHSAVRGRPFTKVYDKRALHTGTIRSLDYWLGVPLCSLLTLVRAILPARTARPERILFLKFIEQGATVLAQDAIARATARVGPERIFFCVFESNRAILDVLGIVPPANVITIRDRRLHTFVIDFLRALAAARSRRIDTVIDMEFFSRASAVFTFLSGARTRVGLHRFTGELPFRGNLMTHRVQYNPHLHIASLYTLLVDAAFLEPVDEPLGKFPLAIAPASGTTATPKHQFVPTPAEGEKIRGLLGAGSPIVIVNPNASDLLPLRKWETSRFIELSRRILDRYPAARIAVTGAPSEQHAAEAMCREVNADRVVSFAGRTNLRELLTLYSVADVLVTNDSGPGHFASLTPVHAVVLFGPETPRLFGSLAPATTIIWKELACSPCVSVFNHRLSPCRNNVCMQAITVDEVLEAVERALAARRTPSAPR
jgi:ADP-heptose:LPS heptosyltransferase